MHCRPALPRAWPADLGPPSRSSRFGRLASVVSAARSDGASLARSFPVAECLGLLVPVVALLTRVRSAMRRLARSRLEPASSAPTPSVTCDPRAQGSARRKGVGRAWKGVGATEGDQPYATVGGTTRAARISIALGATEGDGGLGARGSRKGGLEGGLGRTRVNAPRRVRGTECWRDAGAGADVRRERGSSRPGATERGRPERTGVGSAEGRCGGRETEAAKGFGGGF